MSKHLGLL
jgi:CRP-like cAMP-binding protein